MFSLWKLMDHWIKSAPICTTINLIEQVTRLVGYSVAWLLLLMAIAETGVVILRYGFNMGSIAVQESITYMHATVFLLGAAYTLADDEHVRVDIFYRRASDRTRAWINLSGSVLFLLPLCALIFWSSLPYVAQSWEIRETSADTGGIAGIYLLKTLIPLFAALLFLQGVAQILRSLQAISQLNAEPNNG